MWITTASVLGSGLFVWPLHVVLVAGQNADIALVLALVWTVVLTLLIPSPQPSGIWHSATRILDGVALIVTGAIDAVMLNQLAAMLQTFFYFDTPRAALILPLTAIVGLAVNRAPQTAWRMAMLWVPILIFGTAFILLLAVVNVTHLRPLAPNDQILLMPIFQGVGILAYIGVPIGTTIRLVARKLASEPTPAWRVTAIVIPWVMLAMLYAAVMGSLGPQALTHLRWPVVFALDHVTLDSTFFLSRIGIVVVFSWTLGVALSLMVHIRLGFTWRPMGRLTRLAVTTLVVGIWAIAALVMSSPQTSTRLLLHIIDPTARFYLIAELCAMLALRGFSAVQHRAHLPAANR
ncbi:MAG: hypothetical protein C7B45_02875 [Sulfobacillus acidophilus]|uniref:Uncharacterized protein n=1 Tax=Sulfobacillus acidophilus TaxID=53633 RepID=A0A2T2WMN5_9FIRM|nr:MAG: hypothetical protein C7B45_02875 [Sulfobacillus acidophilus]